MIKITSSLDAMNVRRNVVNVILARRRMGDAGGVGVDEVVKFGVFGLIRYI